VPRYRPDPRPWQWMPFSTETPCSRGTDDRVGDPYTRRKPTPEPEPDSKPDRTCARVVSCCMPFRGSAWLIAAVSKSPTGGRPFKPQPEGDHAASPLLVESNALQRSSGTCSGMQPQQPANQGPHHGP